MSKALKITLIAAGVFLGGLLLLAIFLLFVDLEAFKPRLEAAASSALGMEVSVGGRLGGGLSPGLHLTLKDVQIRNRGTDVILAEEARLGIDFFPLLRKEVRIGKIVLKNPRISIERDQEGQFNFEKTAEAREPLPAMNLAQVTVEDGTLRYADKRSGEEFEAGDCNLSLHPLRLSEGSLPGLMKNLSFSGKLSCGEIRKKDFTVADLKISAEGKNGVIDLDPVTMRVFGSQGTGRIQADYSGGVPAYDVHYSLPHFDIGGILNTLSPQKAAEGSMDFSANLSMQGRTLKEMKPTVQGEFSLRGKNLILHGTDLDEAFSRFESSQSFNLVDVGAFFLAGPVGLAVTKGYNFAGILQGSEGKSEIRTLVSDWKVEGGLAQAQDVAMATEKNRIALQGRLDFINERFDDVTVAVIDAQGCPRVRQTIHGTFENPVVEKPNFLKTLTGPALNLLEMGRDLFPGGECEVFYSGAVAAPE
ncbi:AsmA family protein [Desulfuromonas soudanensis]|uniref:AsmA family protein n=1 Tax=Desulfuromonas soudanensis TaxID=1603606 RepID=A0A0M4D2P1_9BACT|nr:AsmA family protein [Desulfuromonas soudanensis]ALC17296.1 AsmA family protein [Desulfuromonas soudanensis]